MTATVIRLYGASHIARLVRSWRRAMTERAIVRSEYHVLYLEASLRATRLNTQALRVRLALLEDPL